MALKSIGIVGCGAIGRALLKAVDEGGLGVSIAGVTSRTEKSARVFLSTLNQPPDYLDQARLIARSDLVVEAAGGAVVSTWGRALYFDVVFFLKQDSIVFSFNLAQRDPNGPGFKLCLPTPVH